MVNINLFTLKVLFGLINFHHFIIIESISVTGNILLYGSAGPIILFKLPIMLLSNVPKFSLLAMPGYASLGPTMLYYAPN